MLVWVGCTRHGALVAEPRDLLVVHVELRASGQRLFERGDSGRSLFRAGHEGS